MAVETEIKLRLSQGFQPIRALLEQHGFRVSSPRQLETDQTFDRPSDELKNSGRLLRPPLRRGGRWTVTYKGPADKIPVGETRYKSREEIETDVSDAPAFVQILRTCWATSLPSRTKSSGPSAKSLTEEGIVTLDETPIGDFLELEGSEVLD